MKFGQLIKYNKKKNFIEESYRKCGGDTIPDPFLKNQNWAYLWISSLKFLQLAFYCMPSWGLSKYIETKLHTTCFHLIWTFLKNKKSSGTSLSASFSAWSLKENVSLVIFYYLTEFNCLVVFTSWDIGQYIYCICLLTRMWRHKFLWIFKPYLFMIEPFSLHDKKVNTKI